MKMYQVWSGDLNSLYDEVPLPAVIVDIVNTEAEAISLVKETQDYKTAAWFVEVTH